MVAKPANASKTAAEASGEKRLKGVRMRSWGKWVSEIRLPNTRARLWLGSYATAEQAARAFDVAVVCLRGTSAPLNFPHSPPAYAPLGLPHQKIQELAAAAAAAATVSSAPASPSADSDCHLAMPSLETPLASLGNSSISDESDTTTSDTSTSSSQSCALPVSTLNSDAAAFTELRLLDEQHCSALRSSFCSATLHKEMLMKCEWDEPLWASGAFDWCILTACAAPLPVIDDDDDDDVFGPHYLWSL